MLALSSDVWFPAVAFAAGALLTALLEWLREVLRVRRESAERSDGFQRKALADLQEALNDLMRGYEDAYGLRLENLAETEDERVGKHRPRLPEDLRIRILNAERRSIILASRIADKHVRESMNALAKRGTVATWAASFDRADEAFLDARILAEKAMNRTGELMRGSVLHKRVG